jgi:hypothetical protein
MLINVKQLVVPIKYRDNECEIDLIGRITLLTRCVLSAILTIRSLILPVDRA